MAELGPVSYEEHVRIGALAVDLGFAPVIVVGDAPGLARGAGAAAIEVPDAATAVDEARRAIAGGGAILVKGSRVAALEGVAALLAEEATA
jgi:UDP-N-acetylmuramoyl-tripeptide--D-alanyl-D-alanine ligase